MMGIPTVFFVLVIFGAVTQRWQIQAMATFPMEIWLSLTNLWEIPSLPKDDILKIIFVMGNPKYPKKTTDFTSYYQKFI
jgi:hypothetical protein